MATVIELASNECTTVRAVTLYRDRAEVKRTVLFHPSKTGELELKITGITISADPESFRVKGSSGSTYQCKVLEVVHDIVRIERRHVDNSDVLSIQLNEMNTKLKVLIIQICILIFLSLFIH